MGFRINTNILGLNGRRHLEQTTQAIARSLERLSSGKRINRAADDVSGLSIASGLTTHIRGLSQVIRNINEASSIVQTADSATSVLSDIVQRMRELGVQASNGAMSGVDRSYLNDEFQILLEEYRRIVDQTTFNNQRILDGSFSPQVQVGLNKGDQILLDAVNLSANNIFTQSSTTTSSEYTLDSTNALTNTFDTADLHRRTIFADLDGDGHDDMITPGGTPNRLLVRMNNGDGTYGSITTQSFGATTGTTTSNDFQVGDVDGDGNLDLVMLIQAEVAGFPTGYNTYLRYRLGNGDGTFANPSTAAATLIETNTETAPQVRDYSLQLGDLDGDGADEMIVYDDKQRLPTSSGVDNPVGFYVYDSTYSLIDTDTTPGFVPNMETGVVGDIDGDGKEDLVVENSATGDIYVALGQAGGALGAFTNIGSPSGGANAQDYYLEDIDADGDLDLILVGSDLNIRLNDGAGNFSESQAISIGYAAKDARFKDVDGDGLIDIVTSDSNGAGSSISVFLQNSSHEFSLSNTLTGTSFAFNVEDLNGDSLQDILRFTATDNLNYLLSITTSEGPTVSAVSDLNLNSQENAQNVLSLLDAALDNISEKRAGLGALQTRLGHAAQAARLTQESLSVARSGIEDTDFGQETAELAKLQILQQAQLAVLAQTNVQLQSVLVLLRD